MRIAYLITAYNSPEHLGRLTAALAGPRGRTFVHLDAKTDPGPFRTITDAAFIEPRHKVYWGDISMVEAVVASLRQILALRPMFDRIVLISGSDYPLKSSAYIEAFFEARPTTEFMSLVAMPAAEYGKPISRLTRYQPRQGRLDFSRGRRLAVRLGLLPAERDYRAALRSFRPYGGSTWWALTRGACEHLVRTFHEQAYLHRFYANCYIPEESLPHTIIGNSPYLEHVTQGVTYTDWSAGGPHPAQITDAHLDRLLRPGPIINQEAHSEGEVLFARKFGGDSAALTRRIDEARD